MRNFQQQKPANETRPVQFFLYIKGAVFVLLLTASAYSQTSGGGWPRTLHSDGIRIEVYQPQVESWKDGKLDDRVAIAVTEKNTAQSTYGTAWLSAKTTINEDTRMVTLYDVVVKKIIFPAAGTKEQTYIASTTEVLQQWNITMGLDRLLADIAITQNEEPSSDALSNAPPRIFVRDHPAVLILIDGEPIMQRVPGAKIMRVINTPAMIVLDPDSNRYFLRGDGYWMVANSVMGEWSKTSRPPASLSAVLEATDRSPGETTKQASSTPEVIVSTEPAELIQMDGEPQFSPIEDTRLLYVTNTDSDLFMNLPEERYYVLLSGRWFSAATVDGPWEFVAGNALPADFSRIAGGHPKSSVLASVPGTPEARDAVVAAQVPQTATVNRKEASFRPTYDGEPKFKPIAGTDMSYAVNSPDDIIHARGKYYAVSNGVWFVATIRLGPGAFVTLSRRKSTPSRPPCLFTTSSTFMFTIRRLTGFMSGTHRVILARSFGTAWLCMVPVCIIRTGTVLTTTAGPGRGDSGSIMRIGAAVSYGGHGIRARGIGIPGRSSTIRLCGGTAFCITARWQET